MRASEKVRALSLGGPMETGKRWRSVCMLALGVSLLGCLSPRPQREPPPVLMICEHGSVKSLMAASLFNKAAEHRGLPYRAIARGMTPDAAVPALIAGALQDDGFNVSAFQPARFSPAELADAPRIVVIGVEPDKLGRKPAAPIDSWRDVPAASVDYPAAKAALHQHVESLLDDLEAADKR
jgi:arsenate reductase